MFAFIGFFAVVFLATTQRELRGKAFRTRYVFLLAAMTTISMLSLRVIE